MVRKLNYASVNSSCAQQSPPPPHPHGLLRGICLPRQSQGWAQAFANPRAIPKLLTCMLFPIRIYNYTEDFTRKNKHIGSSVNDRKKLKRVVEVFLNFMHAFLHCLSSQNYIAKSGAIDATQRFLVKLNQTSFDIIWRTSLHILLDTTYNFIVLY